MKYLSVCSGIEAATQAWHPLGWEPIAFSEIDKFSCKVLAHYYPEVQNLSDMTKFKEWNIERPDLLVGGTPCQSFSVAGLRKGLDDPRGNLMLTYLAIAERFKPKWICWENVPGVLSSNGGKDFGTFLGALGELGYGFAYRVLDAQFVRTDGYPHAVPQRRRRVFVVGYFGDWRRAAAVLFDSESLRGNPPPSRKKREEVAETIRNGTCSGKQTFGTLMANCGQKQWLGNQEAFSGDYHVFDKIVFDESQITSKENRSRVESGLPCGTLNQKGRMTIALAGNTIGREPQNGGNGTGFDESGVSFTLTKTDVHAVSIGRSEELTTSIELAGTLLRGGQSGRHDGVMQSDMQVRRLTPLECERLQAFPDNFTNIPGASDGARYKALGNAMAVNVMQLIGQRIQMCEDISVQRVVP